ncbi:MAG: GNAT family N-acetyltransferase [Beijerinckiaceae bacterium]
MLLFTRMLAARPDLVMEADPLLIRPPQMSDFVQWAALRAKSREFLQGWEPTWPTDDLTKSAFRRRIIRYLREIDRDESYPFFIFTNADGRLVGGLNLTNIRRGAAAMATLGYWMGAPYAGKGIMTAAVNTVLDRAFTTLKLRRIEAACVPENVISIRLLEKAGFVREGYARDYLLINGQWRDHVLFAKLAGRSVDRML